MMYLAQGERDLCLAGEVSSHKTKKTTPNHFLSFDKCPPLLQPMNILNVIN